MKPVTDPALLAQLDQSSPVTDPALLAELEEKPEERGIVSQAARAVGRTARAGLEGITAIPGMLANAPAALYNKVADFMSPPTLSSQVTGERGFRFPDQSRFGAAIADAIGLPHAENAQERIAEDVAGGMAGAGGLVKAGAKIAEGAGSAIVKRISEALAANPTAQLVSGAAGPGAAGTVREAGGGPVAQAVAGVVGGFSPAIPAAAKAAVRGLARGGEAGRQRVADNIATFEEAGAGTPTVGQATERRGSRTVESALAKSPGGAGPMVAKAEAEAAGMGAKVEDMAAQLAAKSGAAPAGRQIKSGVEHFVEDFKARSAGHYDKVDQYIPPDTLVPATNVLAKVAELTKPIPGAKATSTLIATPKLGAVGDALAKDSAAKPAQPIISTLLGPDGQPIVTGQTLAQPGGIPYQALKELRTAIGAKLTNPSLVDDVSTGQWKQLYGALTRDMGAAARAAGPEAEQAMVRASNHYRAGMQRIEDVLKPIVAKGDPEDIFTAALSGTKEGATTLQGVMKSLPIESRKVVAASALRRLGTATPGKQSELGEVFSTESFLTNWNKLHPDAKASLFSSMPDGMRSDLNKIAKVAANVREGSKVFANPSGTAQALSNRDTVGAAIIALFTGHPVAATAIAATIPSANVSARLLTNPTVVRWLANSTRVPIEQLPAQLNALSQLTWNMKREDREEVQAFVSEMRGSKSK